jgi:Secretion system C-terminal sorting domain
MKKIALLLLSIVFISNTKAQIVNIPDPIFKSYLVGINSLNNNPSDTEISVLEAQSYNGTIDCSNLGISDLTGIEAFTGYITLNCSGNNLVFLDLSACVNITGHLQVQQNVLTLLTLPNSPDVSQLTCSGNNLTIIDLTPVPNLANMWAGNNPTSVFTHGNMPAMVGFNIAGNSLTSLDLSDFPNLQWVNAEVSTVLTSLDISPCPSLNNLYVNQSPLLESLDMTNGNYMNFPPNWFVATDCPALSCVTVDNVLFANTAWATAVDPGVTFSTNCTNSIALNEMQQLSVFPNPSTGVITLEVSEPTRIEITTTTGQIIRELEVNGNTTIDVSTFTTGIYFIKTSEGQSVRFIKE